MSGPAPRVAFQGELGAFSEEAVHRFFGRAEPVPRPAFDDVVEAVVNGRASYGLLPVENTLHGGVTGAYDALVDTEIEVVGEVILPIRHCLLGVAGATLDRLSRVVSHPVALAQCTRVLRALPVEVVAVYDTAGAARAVAETGDPVVAAVASRSAGDRYGLRVLQADIQDRDDNQTRFFVLARRGGVLPAGALESDQRKTALLCETANEPGALFRLLEPFAAREINLTKLESRPGPTPWTYRFFLEFGHGTGPGTDEALTEARRRAVALQVLGTFPRAGDPRPIAPGSEDPGRARRRP